MSGKAGIRYTLDFDRQKVSKVKVDTKVPAFLDTRNYLVNEELKKHSSVENDHLGDWSPEKD